MLEIRWVYKNLKGVRKRYCVAIVLNIVLALFFLIWPVLTRYIVDNIIVGTADPVSGEIVRHTEELLPVLVLWICLVLVRNILNLVFIWCKESANQQMLQNIRLRMFSSLTAQEGSFFARNNGGDLLTSFTHDVDVVGYNVRYISFKVVNTVIMFFSAVIYFFTINSTLTLCLLSVLPFIFLTSMRFKKEMRPMYVANRQRLTELNDMAQENIDANKTVRAFAREDYENERFFECNSSYQEAVLESNKKWLSIWPIPEFLSQFLTVIVLVAGGLLVIKGEMSLADLTAFTTFVWALADAIRNIGNLLNEFQRFFPSAGKVIEIFYAAPRITSRSDALVPKERIRGDVRFDHVSFEMDGRKIIDDVSFDIPAGKTLAVVGETGSGKTTLVNLLARFFDVTSGSITVDGTDTRLYDLRSLRGSIGMATQDVFLFSDTIDGNIAFGRPDMPEEEVRECAVRSAADEFISGLENGYETIIGERGMGLSGGQRQRVALARAMAVKPPILVLDDTTSAVDTETERFIWDQLRSLPFPCTKIIIAQRVTTVAGADRIIVMEKGRITAQGTHSELISRPGFYRDIYEIQSQQTE